MSQVILTMENYNCNTHKNLNVILWLYYINCFIYFFIYKHKLYVSTKFQWALAQMGASSSHNNGMKGEIVDSRPTKYTSKLPIKKITYINIIINGHLNHLSLLHPSLIL